MQRVLRTMTTMRRGRPYWTRSGSEEYMWDGYSEKLLSSLKAHSMWGVQDCMCERPKVRLKVNEFTDFDNQWVDFPVHSAISPTMCEVTWNTWELMSTLVMPIEWRRRHRWACLGVKHRRLSCGRRDERSHFRGGRTSRWKRRWDDVMKLAREQVQQTLYTDRVVRENGNFYCHERPVCSWSPWRKNWAGSMDWTAAMIHWIWLNETRAKWPWRKVKQPGIGTREPINQEHSQQQANTKSSRSNPVWQNSWNKTARKGVGADVPEDVPQSENVDETRRSKKTSPYACTVEPPSPSWPAMGYRGARSRTPWFVSRASYVLEMAFSKAGAAVRFFKRIRRMTSTRRI